MEFTRNKFAKSALFLAILASFSVANVYAQEIKSEQKAGRDWSRHGNAEGKYYNNQTGYGKRPRAELGSAGFVSPSQLHEVYGTHVGAQAQMQNAKLDDRNGFDLSSFQVDARALYGAAAYTLGLGLGYQEQDISNNSDDQINRRVMSMGPQGSYSINRNWTAGLSGNMNLETIAVHTVSNIKGISLADLSKAGDQDADLSYWTLSPAVSYHDAAKEFGLMYTSSAKASADLSRSEDQTSVYSAPVTTIFARGNLTDAFSLFGNMSYASFERATEYNKNLVWQDVSVYDRYALEDRVGAKIGAAFWTSARSRFTLAGTYTGGALPSAAGIRDSIGYYSASNRYGLEGAANVRIKADASLAATIDLSRGERRETVSGKKISQSDQRLRLGTAFNVWL